MLDAANPAPDAAPFIRIQGVTKTFGDFVAVDSISLDIRRGELFCLLGGSGSGKSTLLRMLAGFDAPTEGRIEIDGRDMAGAPPYKRPVNMMFQSYALFPHMSVARNVGYGLRREGLPRAEIRERVEEMLRLVKLTDFAHRKPHQLSGGQRQRVALARALVKRPKALLLDEPLGALDKKLREETQFELMNLQQRLNLAFIVVTHDQEEAMTLADRIGVMDHGRLVQVGPPREIYEHPNSRFVAGFIGSVTLFEGRVVEEDDDHALIESADFGGRILIGHGTSGAPGREVAFAIRPEKIDMTRQKPDASREESRNSVEGVVEEAAYLGDMSLYRVRLDSGALVNVSQTNRDRHAAEAPIDWDERVWLSWGPWSGVVLSA